MFVLKIESQLGEVTELTYGTQEEGFAARNRMTAAALEEYEVDGIPRRVYLYHPREGWEMGTLSYNVASARCEIRKGKTWYSLTEDSEIQQDW